MGKILIIIILSIALFFLTLLSILTIAQQGNTKIYYPETKTVEIRNPGGQHLANFTLLTPLNFHVFYGTDVLVAKFQIVREVQRGGNILHALDLQDKKNNNKTISRNINYKYEEIIGTINITDSEIRCFPFDKVGENQTSYVFKNCSSYEIGSHLKNKTKWTPINIKGKNLPKNNIKIGIFADVKDGDNIEWIPTFFGLEIDEWAEWTESFDDRLWMYYSLNESSGDFLDLMQNVTGDEYILTTRGVQDPTINSGSVTFSGVADHLNITDYPINMDAFSINFWLYDNDFSDNGVAGFYTRSINCQGEGSGSGFWIANNIGGGNFQYGFANSQFNTIAYPTTNEWHMITATYDGTTGALYIDGKINVTGSGSGLINGANTSIAIGNDCNEPLESNVIAHLDEFAFWSRNLSYTEISTLYDSGTGTFKTQVGAGDKIIPGVTIIFPIEGEIYGSRDLPLNFSVNLDENGSVQYSLNQGLDNITMFDVTNRVGSNFNHSNNSMVIGSFNFQVYANDTNNNINHTENLTFHFDAVNPQLVINEPVNETTLTSNTVDINITATDDNSTSACYYNITRGANLEIANTYFSDCKNTSTATAVVSGDATYVINIFMNDTADNVNISASTFTVDTFVEGGGGGGGGGRINGGIEIPVVGLQEIEGSKSYDDLERMIIYATINNYCSEKVTREPLAIQDFSESCSLLDSDIELILIRLQEFDVVIIKEDLVLFINNYRDRLLFQGFTTKENIIKFDLFSSVLGLTTLLQIVPPSIDTFAHTFQPDGGEKIIPFLLTSNKLLKSCEVISETSGLSCSVDNSTIRGEFLIEDTAFFTKVFTGTLLLTTEVQDEETIEQRRVRITFRVINSGYKNIALLIGGGLALAIIVFFVVRRKKRKVLGKQFRDLLKLGK